MSKKLKTTRLSVLSLYTLNKIFLHISLVRNPLSTVGNPLTTVGNPFTTGEKIILTVQQKVLVTKLHVCVGRKKVPNEIFFSQGFGLGDRFRFCIANNTYSSAKYIKVATQ